MDQDKSVAKIKDVIKTMCPKSEVVLFGSRAKGNVHVSSDYDVLVIIDEGLTVKEKWVLAGTLRKRFAEMGLDVDIIVKTYEDRDYYRDKIGSIVKEALETGIKI
jgi:predicted nucleotidyltransferase